MKFFQDPSRATIILILLIMAGVSNNLHWGKDNWRYTLDADAKGYFAYLPAVFVYQDLNYGFYDELEGDRYFIDSQHYDYRVNINSRYTNKYPAGAALLCAPFYLGAHLFCTISGGSDDGYSAPYILSVTLAALFYLALGLFFFNKLMQAYGVSSWNRAIVLFALSFGTHLFNYSVVEPGFSHVYSFGLIGAFMYFVHRWAKTNKGVIVVGILLGLIILVRPINILVVLAIPFISGGVEPYLRAVKKMFSEPRSLSISLLLCFGIAFVQPIINKLTTGAFFIDTYAGEHFIFASPHMFDFLFSYKKGLFLYTPLCFLAIFGSIALFKKNKQAAGLWLAFILVLVYVTSSWHNWWYGGSFSARPFVEYLPFFFILLALLLQAISAKWKRALLVAVVFLLIGLNQIQTYQYRYYEIHYEDMDKEKYWDVFLRIDRLIK